MKGENMSLLKKILISVFILVGISISLYFLNKNKTYTNDINISRDEIIESSELLNSLINKENNRKNNYFTYLEKDKINYNLINNTSNLVDYDGSDQNHNYTIINDSVSAKYETIVLEEGYYYLKLNYRIDEISLNEMSVSISINNKKMFDEMNSIILPQRWSDESKNYSKDRYGDEVLSNQKSYLGWYNEYLYNNTYLTIDPLLFYFDAGFNIIELANNSNFDIAVSDLELIAPKKDISYLEYKKENNSDFSDLINIEATDYINKNSNYVKSFALNDSSAYPYHPVYKKLNVIDGITWNIAGQSLSYEFDVKTEGNYEISFHYLNDKNDFSVFRSIYIDEEIPFKELKSYEFKPTKGFKMRNHTLGDENGNYKFYLTKGKHKITLKAETETVSESLELLQKLIDHINAFTLLVRKHTGKNIDKDRTWKFSEYVKETPDYLLAYQKIIKYIISDLSKYSEKSVKSATLSYLQKSLNSINKIYKDYDRLPLYLEDLSGGSGSVSQYLGDSLTMIKDQPLYLDNIYISTNSKLPREKASFIKSFKNSFKSFASSFTTNKYKLDKDEDVVDVWVNRPITYVDTMQKLVDQNFTPKTGINVKLSVMPDSNKLIMASAAKMQPDVALGLASFLPYDLAIRNSAYDLTSFPDFWEVASEFAPGAFIPYILNEKAYALPETLDFNVLMYRKDIFDELNFMVPDTWEEVIQILPELQQYGMNFYHPIAGGSGTKYFYQTSGFIYQFGGSLYEENGIKTAIDQAEAIEGLKFLNQLFTNYSLPEQVQSFYNAFRYATLPIGISDFNNYLSIKNAAPELAGLWDIAPYPSITKNGSTNRYYMANGTAGMILGDTKKANESWRFLKWWLSEDIQTQFSFNIQSTYGPTYTWLSGNVNAFKNSPLPKKDREIIFEQTKWLIDAPRTPGQYMLERSLSDIWNSVVFQGKSTGVAVDNYKILIDREIKKKMIEFGYINSNGDLLKEYKVPNIEWIQAEMLKATGGYHGFGG